MGGAAASSDSGKAPHLGPAKRLLLPFSQIQDEGLGKFLFLQTKMTCSCNLAVSTSVIHWWALRLYAASHCACLGSLAH